MKLSPAPTLHHLFEQPQLLTAAATMIHTAFWVGRPGASAERMASRLQLAGSADAVPLCRVACSAGGGLVGVVNLVENDDDDHADWTPWLAGLIVDEAVRGQGVGSALVQDVLRSARELGFEHVYLGTDGPGFYTRLGAVVHHRPRSDFWFLRFDLPAR